MKQIMIKNTEGALINASVVRYFRLNSMEYLIFSLNEIDEGGYAKLYVTKIVDGVGRAIEDDVEWNLIKDTIKTIVKSNKDNLPLPITDLNTTNLIDMQVMDQKIFKLNDSLLQLLMQNVQEDTKEIYMPVEDVNDVINATELPVTEFDGSQNLVDSEPVASITNFDEENAPASEVASTNDSSEYALDYKALYENELNKNEDLIREIEKYKETINNIKNIIDNNL